MTKNNSRRRGRGFQYLVRWEGYGPGEDSWQPAAVIEQDAPIAVSEFYAKNPGAPRRIAASVFAELAQHFRTPHTDPSLSDLPEDRAAFADLAWDDGKIVGNDYLPNPILKIRKGANSFEGERSLTGG
ncbi:hypothetical protein BDW22DRAFT_1446944 [Trametopsis cervina]|nr:hypothetical protein BDW22DRAFT_1446944 [Trametopsis cervina]